MGTDGSTTFGAASSGMAETERRLTFRQRAPAIGQPLCTFSASTRLIVASRFGGSPRLVPQLVADPWRSSPIRRRQNPRTCRDVWKWSFGDEDQTVKSGSTLW